MRKTTISMRSRRRSPLRNEFEVSPQIFWAECSTRWLSAQHFRSIIQPNYQHGHILAIKIDRGRDRMRLFVRDDIERFRQEREVERTEASHA